MLKSRKQPRMAFSTGDDVKVVRGKLGLNQSEFWGPIGVTQSGGSRYEAGRRIPVPTQCLLTITYGTRRQAEAAVTALRSWQKQGK